MKLRKIEVKPKGFTIIELLIEVSIGCLIILALLSLYSASQRYFITESARTDIIRDSRYVLDWISQDMKEAAQVLSSWEAYDTSSTCVVLQVPSVDSDGQVIDIESEFDHIIYRLNPQNPNKLERIIDANDGISSRVDSTRVITDKADSFLLSSEGVEFSAVSDFSQISNIDIAVVTTQSRFNHSYQDTLNTKVKLRNKL